MIKAKLFTFLATLFNPSSLPSTTPTIWEPFSNLLWFSLKAKHSDLIRILGTADYLERFWIPLVSLYKFSWWAILWISISKEYKNKVAWLEKLEQEVFFPNGCKEPPPPKRQALNSLNWQAQTKLAQGEKITEGDSQGALTFLKWWVLHKVLLSLTKSSQGTNYFACQTG